MDLRTSNVNNHFWGTIVIPIPKCISRLRWWFDGKNFHRFIVISWGRNHD